MRVCVCACVRIHKAKLLPLIHGDGSFGDGLREIWAPRGSVLLVLRRFRPRGCDDLRVLFEGSIYQGLKGNSEALKEWCYGVYGSHHSLNSRPWVRGR